tara:strand:+ start:1977 stop:2459 length:483 start_codon:yes stop_codon:yes gene_type:complete
LEKIIMWKRLSGTTILDTLEDTILSDISKLEQDDLKFYIGCDSQFRRGKVVYGVVLVILREGKGGSGYFNRIHKRGRITTQQRLFQETYYAVKLATRINPLLESIGYKVEEIHTDLNPNKNYVSSTMIQQCLGFIKGMGFEGKTKPNSWAASSVADIKTK